MRGPLIAGGEVQINSALSVPLQIWLAYAPQGKADQPGRN